MNKQNLSGTNGLLPKAPPHWSDCQVQWLLVVRSGNRDRFQQAGFLRVPTWGAQLAKRPGNGVGLAHQPIVLLQQPIFLIKNMLCRRVLAQNIAFFIKRDTKRQLIDNIAVDQAFK